MSGILNIHEAKRASARLVIGLAGISGGGKTRTAIELAYGLAGYDASKVGLLDTENKRGSLYSYVLHDHKTHPTKTPFLIGDLEPPFSPDRYSQAVKEFEAAGVEVLVIDSTSHEWNGLGGYLDIKAAAGPGGSMKKKPLHKRFVNVMLQSNMHIIACTRATSKLDWSDKNNPKPLGILPVQEDEFMFEMTAHLMMYDEGKYQDVRKCPSELRPYLGRGEGYITSEDGYAIRKWVEGGEPVDPKVEKLRNALRGETEKGEKHLSECWGKLSKAQQDAVGSDFFGTLIESAREYDKQRTSHPEESGADALNKQLGDE